MSRSNVRFINMFLAVLLLLSGMPKIEHGHAHDGGSSPHHHKAPRHSSKDNVHSAHHHNHHHHSNDPHEHDEWSSSQHHSESDDDTGSPNRFRSTDSADRHFHLGLIGWLTGEDFGPMNEKDVLDVENRSEVLIKPASPIDSLARNLSLGIAFCVAIVPYDDPLELCVKLPLFRFARFRSGAPPLCDSARHERSGVQLI